MQYRSSTPEFDRTIEGFNSGEHLANARRQADARKLDDVLIVDVDCHHYETDNFAEILEYMEDPVIKQVAINTFAYKGAAAVLMMPVAFISNSMSAGAPSSFCGSSIVRWRSGIPLSFAFVCTTPGARMTMSFFDALNLSAP